MSSCPGKCMNKCEGECEEAGHSLRERQVGKNWGKTTENPNDQSATFVPSSEARQCYQKCYFQCAEEGKCLSCEDSCDQVGIHLFSFLTSLKKTDEATLCLESCSCACAGKNCAIVSVIWRSLR